MKVFIDLMTKNIPGKSDYIYIWTEHLPFILDDIPLVFGIDENNHEEIWLFRLLLLHIVRNANERCQEYFKSI